MFKNCWNVYTAKVGDLWQFCITPVSERWRVRGTALQGSYKQIHQGIPNFKGLNEGNGMVRFKKADPHVKKEARFLPKN